MPVASGAPIMERRLKGDRLVAAQSRAGAAGGRARRVWGRKGRPARDPPAAAARCADRPPRRRRSSRRPTRRRFDGGGRHHARLRRCELIRGKRRRPPPRKNSRASADVREGRPTKRSMRPSKLVPGFVPAARSSIRRLRVAASLFRGETRWAEGPGRAQALGTRARDRASRRYRSRSIPTPKVAALPPDPAVPLSEEPDGIAKKQDKLRPDEAPPAGRGRCDP